MQLCALGTEPCSGSPATPLPVGPQASGPGRPPGCLGMLGQTLTCTSPRGTNRGAILSPSGHELATRSHFTDGTVEVQKNKLSSP